MNYTFVTGGADKRCPFKIGRVQYQNELIVGRVTCKLDDAALYVAYEKNYEIRFETYEILTYNKDVQSDTITYAKTLKCEQ